MMEQLRWTPGTVSLWLLTAGATFYRCVPVCGCSPPGTVSLWLLTAGATFYRVERFGLWLGAVSFLWLQKQKNP